MTEDEYRAEIERKCEALGVWREEFSRARDRLAAIYVRIDKTEEGYIKTGGNPIVMHTNKAKEKNLARNPFLTELDALYTQALTHERELGLTASALKKINEGALHPAKKISGLENTLRLLEA